MISVQREGEKSAAGSSARARGCEITCTGINLAATPYAIQTSTFKVRKGKLLSLPATKSILPPP
jgi:hypothetical protein